MMNPPGLKVLIACEFSGIVRDAFRKLGHEAWSCDLLGPDELPDEFQKQAYPNYHLEGDIRELIDVFGWQWDLMIAHPPCTHLAVSGARWFKDKLPEQRESLEFVRWLMARPIPHIAIENPVSIISSRIRKPDQIIQPWQFGHGETKATCLWLKNLPPLVPTRIVNGREPKVHRMAPSPTRWLERSRTYAGIAEAMASQWGDFVEREKQ